MRAGFVPGCRGDLFQLRWDASRGPVGSILCVPPFAEEMNKSRRMLRVQAERLSRLGWDVYLHDLYGTGDSAGEFEQARWEIWLDDLALMVRTGLRRPDLPLVLWGVRLGSLLALDLLRSGALPGSTRVLLWQPVVSGDLFMQQFLRLKLASQMLGSASEMQSTAALRAELEAGHGVEVAGYLLHPEMYRAAVERRPMLPVGCCAAARLIEVAAAPRDASPASRALVTQFEASGASAVASCVVGPAFWGTVEIEMASALLDATDAQFVAWAAA